MVNHCGVGHVNFLFKFILCQLPCSSLFTDSSVTCSPIDLSLSVAAHVSAANSDQGDLMIFVFSVIKCVEKVVVGEFT